MPTAEVPNGDDPSEVIVCPFKWSVTPFALMSKQSVPGAMVTSASSRYLPEAVIG
jgi:hypothetical protein